MILIKDKSEFTIKHIEYDLLQVIIRGLKNESVIQDNINLLIVENMAVEEIKPHDHKQIEYLKDLRIEIEKIISDYEQLEL
jgi:hypothetical protein